MGARAVAAAQRWCLRARALLARRPGSSLRASARSSSWRGYDSGSLPSHCGVLVARRRAKMSAVSPALAGVCPSTARRCARPRVTDPRQSKGDEFPKVLKLFASSKPSFPPELPILCTAQASGRFSLASCETLATTSSTPRRKIYGPTASHSWHRPRQTTTRIGHPIGKQFFAREAR